MAKITLENGMVLEGTPEELVELAKGFEAEEKPFEVGDYVKVTGDTRLKDISVGSYAKVISDLDDDDEYQIELIDESDYDYAQAHVIEKVSEEEATKEEFEADNKPKEEAFKIGDYVKIVGDRTGYCSFGYGDVVKVVGLDGWHGDSDRLICEDTEGHQQSIERDDVVKVTEKEIAEATKPKTKFKVGDYVKAVKSNSGHVGKIFVVTHVFDHPETYNGITYTFAAKSVDDRETHTGFSNDDRSVLATEEEVAKAKAEVKWSKIVRKVDEYKKGDIVRVLEDNANGSEHKGGDIGEIVTDGDEFSDGAFRVKTPRIDFVNWVRPRDIELITPVEARFDR